MINTQTDWNTLLHQAGCRVTAPREAVIAVLRQSSHPLGIYELHTLAREQSPHLGLVTVYRTVEKLIELNLVQRIHQPHGQPAYLPVATADQHILLCQRCGHIVFFDSDVSALAGATVQKTGYQISKHWLQLFGLCADCQS